jgi:hypothetical protein
MTQLIINDRIEKLVADGLTEMGILFTHETQNKEQQLDFYLPEFDIFIECKAFSSDRTNNQIKDKKVILVQSIESAQFFCELCFKEK